ncbi:MAG: ABC transporter ATP-binding protein [Clostridiales bacterium]|nr:ABC transporter ATP-binding protein [Clostridiales bacterium]
MIEVKNLVKRYGDFEAVRGVSFTVQKGMIYGFLGPNGAGKSTTMNIITGTLAATEGEVTVNGCDIYEDPIGAKSAIGYLPEQPPLYPDMTPEEYLAFVGEARGLRGDELWGAIDRVVEKTGLGEYANRLIKNLSKGYRQRVGIAQAILTDPEIIILDEPTVGLDPRQIIEIRELIRQLGRDHTVILSSHILTEISAVCDYVIIIARGKIVASDTLENLTKQYEGKNYIDLTVRGEEASVRRAVESISGVEEISVDPKPLGLLHVRIATDSSADIREDVFFRFADAKMPILSMEYEEVTLEKVFLELTGEKADSQPSVEPPVNAPQTDVADETQESAEEETPAPEPEAIPAEEPAPAKPQKAKKSGDDDDYTPLFGG